MPHALTMIQTRKLTPAPAVLVRTGITIAIYGSLVCLVKSRIPLLQVITVLSMLYLTSSSINGLMNYVGFATWLAIGTAVFCLPWLRWKRPDMDRPIRVNLVSARLECKSLC